MSAFGKSVWDKVKAQKSTVLIHSNIKQLKTKLNKKKQCLIMALKTIKIRRSKPKGCSRPLPWKPRDGAGSSERPKRAAGLLDGRSNMKLSFTKK